MSDAPTDADLERIAHWDGSDPLGWFAFIKTCWWSADWGWREGPCPDPVPDDLDALVTPGQMLYRLSTGGWSGNEELIAAMEQNRTLWAFTALAWRRGGQYVFHIGAALTPCG